MTSWQPGEGEREPLFRLAQAQCATVLFADKGFWGAEYQRTIGLIDVELVTPERHRLGERPPVEVVKATIRLVIESVFSNLKRQMRLEEHLAKTPGGLVQRVAQRLLALTLGMFINAQLGRPPTRRSVPPSRLVAPDAQPRLPLRHRLLPQPYGFEGLSLVVELLVAEDLARPEGADHVVAAADLGLASGPASVLDDDDQHPVPVVGDALDLPSPGVKVLKPSLPGFANARVPPVDAPVGALWIFHPLDVRVAGLLDQGRQSREQRFLVEAVRSCKEPGEEVHVLLRHRPPSIPRMGEGRQ